MLKFIKNISLYIVGYILIRAISFFLLPLYTNSFTKEEFGVFSVLFIFIAFAQFFYSYGMDASLMKFFVKIKNHKKIYSTIFISLLFSSSFFSALIWLFSTQISFLLLKVDYSYFFKIASIILFFDSFSFRILVVHRMENFPIRYLLFSLTSVITTFLANFYFIYIMGWGIVGALYSTLLGSLSIFILSLPFIINRVSFSHFSFLTLKNLLFFGFPFLPSIIFQMIIDFSDRQLLVYLTDLETVGLYSASYKISSILLFLISGFRLGWEPFFLKLNKNRSDIISKVSNLFILFLITILLFTILFIEPIIINSYKYFKFSIIGESFWSALPIIPIIMFGYLFLALYHLQMPAIFYFNKTSLLPLFRFFGAFSNIILNLLLIPFWGIFGAAIATMFSFIFMALPMFLYTNKLFKIQYNWIIILLYLTYTLMIYYVNSIYSINLLGLIILFLLGLFMIVYELKKTFLLLKKDLN